MGGNIHHVKTYLSRLIVRLVRFAVGGKQRRLGSAQGQIWFGKGWDAPLTDEEIEQLIGE